jgi:hypothetical protein
MTLHLSQTKKTFITHQDNIHLDSITCQGDVKSLHGYIVAKGSDIHYAHACKNIDLYDTQVRRVHSASGHVFINYKTLGKVESVKAEKDIDLYKVAVGQDVISVSGSITAYKSRLNKIQSAADITALNTQVRYAKAGQSLTVYSEDDPVECRTLISEGSLELHNATVIHLAEAISSLTVKHSTVSRAITSGDTTLTASHIHALLFKVEGECRLTLDPQSSINNLCVDGSGTLTIKTEHLPHSITIKGGTPLLKFE